MTEGDAEKFLDDNLYGGRMASVKIVCTKCGTVQPITNRYPNDLAYDKAVAADIRGLGWGFDTSGNPYCPACKPK